MYVLVTVLYSGGIPVVACSLYCPPLSHTQHTLTHTHHTDTYIPYAHAHMHAHTHTESGCNLFNFSLSGIGHSEFAIESDLHLYMTLQYPFTERLTIEIRKFKQEDDVEDFITSKEILPVKEPGWLVFPMQAYLSELIPEGKYTYRSY